MDQGSQDLTWYFGAMRKQPSDSASISEVSALAAGLEDLIEAQNFGLISGLLNGCMVENVRTAFLIALARSLFAHRQSITGYWKFIERARNAIESRGKDAAKLLRGII